MKKDIDDESGEKEKLTIGLAIGKGKTWLQRLQTYISVVSFLMIFYVFIDKNDWFEWYNWLLLIIVVCTIILYIDIKHVMGNALGYQWDKNKSFKRLEKKVDSVMEALGVTDCKK